MKKVTIYRDDSVTQVRYDNVKHVFMTANNTILTIAQVTNVKTGAYQYINWNMNKIAWYKIEDK